MLDNDSNIDIPHSYSYMRFYNYIWGCFILTRNIFLSLILKIGLFFKSGNYKVKIYVFEIFNTFVNFVTYILLSVPPVVTKTFKLPFFILTEDELLFNIIYL